jgi:hypothetical protein
MLRVFIVIATCAPLLAAHAAAADDSCAKKELGVKLNELDLSIKNRQEAVAEMQAEAKEAGGTTDQHKKALESFEEKLAKVTAERATLLARCNTE